MHTANCKLATNFAFPPACRLLNGIIGAPGQAIIAHIPMCCATVKPGINMVNAPNKGTAINTETSDRSIRDGC